MAAVGIDPTPLAAPMAATISPGVSVLGFSPLFLPHLQSPSSSYPICSPVHHHVDLSLSECFFLASSAIELASSKLRHPLPLFSPTFPSFRSSDRRPSILGPHPSSLPNPLFLSQSAFLSASQSLQLAVKLYAKCFLLLPPMVGHRPPQSIPDLSPPRRRRHRRRRWERKTGDSVHAGPVISIGPSFGFESAHSHPLGPISPSVGPVSPVGPHAPCGSSKVTVGPCTAASQAPLPPASPSVQDMELPQNVDEQGWTTVSRKSKHPHNRRKISKEPAILRANKVDVLDAHAKVHSPSTTTVSPILAPKVSPPQEENILKCLDQPNSLAFKLKSDLLKNREEASTKKESCLLSKRLCPKVQDPMYVWS